MTGTQRYTAELLRLWNGKSDTIAPQTHARGMGGHAWEQLVLPASVSGRLLFSPANTGPLAIRNQVSTIHDMSPFDCPETFSRAFVSWYRFLLPKLANTVKHIITVSEFTKSRIITHTHVKESKIIVIPNGVAPRFRPQAVAELDAVLAALRVPSRRYILSVGSQEPRKNLPRLLNAWSKVQSQIPDDIWLVIVGFLPSSRVFSTPLFEEEADSRVFWTGHIMDTLLPPLVAGALASVYLSYYEGFGLPVLEAMASGTPVVAASGSSLPEVVGDAGLLANPFDVESIADAITQIINRRELRVTLRDKALKRAQEFSWANTAQRTWQVLESFA